MHPTKDELKKYIFSEVSEDNNSKIELHLNECEFCQEFIENYKEINGLIEAEEKLELPPKINELRDKLFRQAQKNNVIPLALLSTETDSDEYFMAADSADVRTGIENISTYYSEDPDLILRLMRDNDNNSDYIQLIASDEKLASHVIVEIPELNYSCMTDKNGKAIIADVKQLDIVDNKWQIKLPDAIFELKELAYDRNKTEYSNGMILTTEKSDKIKVTFDGKTEGKQIRIEILSIEGKDDFGNINVAIIQDDILVSNKTALDKTISFKIDKSSEIKIRLFQ